MDLEIGRGTYLSHTTVAVKQFVALGGKWQREHVTWREPSGVSHAILLVLQYRSGANTHFATPGPVYTDGWQLEAKDHPTTYVDGDVGMGLLVESPYGHGPTQ